MIDCSDMTVNGQHMLTYLYLLAYVVLSSAVILYNKVKLLCSFIPRCYL